MYVRKAQREVVMVVGALLLVLPVTWSAEVVYHLQPEHKSANSQLQHSIVLDTLQGGHQEVDDGSSQETASFPYKFENMAMAAQKKRKVSLGTPYAAIKGATPLLSGASERLDLTHITNTAENLNLPSLEDIIPHVHQHKKRPSASWSLWPSQPLTKTELDFVGILAAIGVKLVLSTALSTWFLAAGQALYSVAALTGTTDIFGMDSAIKFIYKTVPFVEALLRGEDMLT